MIETLPDAPLSARCRMNHRAYKQSWELEGNQREQSWYSLVTIRTHLFVCKINSEQICGAASSDFCKMEKHGISTLGISLSPQRYLLLSPEFPVQDSDFPLNLVFKWPSSTSC